MANHTPVQASGLAGEPNSQACVDRHKLNADLYQALMDPKQSSHVLSRCRNLPGEGPFAIITIRKDTVLHMACYSKQKDLALDLLQLLDSHSNPTLNDRLAETKNDVHNTILHEVATHDTMIEVADDLLKRAPTLLTARNVLGETPLFLAVQYGKGKMFRRLADELGRRHFKTETERQCCLWRDDRTTILHISIFTQNFDLALYIANRYGFLISALDGNEMTALQHLACNPSAFLRGSEPRRRLRLFIFSCIPNRGRAGEGDVDSWQDTNESNGFRWPIWEALKEEKHRYETACKLASKLLENDISWASTHSQAVDKSAPTRSISQQEGEGSLALLSKETKEEDDDDIEGKTPPKGKRTMFGYMRSKETPLFLATMSGIPEIVKEILEKYPQAIDHYNDEERNILHVAINYRQIEIFDMVVKMEMPARRLLRATDAKGNSILHMVGKKGKRYVLRKSRSPAIQLQEELLLFERVKAYSKSHFLRVLNHKNQTADELFASNYCQLHKEAKEWVKRTAENCTIVAVLIATVAFAGAYTVPGGPNEDTGTPILLDQPFFVVFTLADAISLTYALTSVITFLSILTSPFQLEDFKKSLLRKLMLGFTFLILSVSMMMLAFGATVILMIRNKHKWKKFVSYSVALLPVFIFALSHSQLYYRLLKACSGMAKVLLELCPRWTFAFSSSLSWKTKLFHRRETKPGRTIDSPV